MKILIIALSGIGDALMFTPALKLLRESKPDAQIDVLVMFGGAAGIFKRNPNVNNILHFNFLDEGAAKSLNYISKIRRTYDASINVYPSNRKEYNIISFLAGAKKRVSAIYKRSDAKNLGFLNNVRISENDKTHNVKTNIKMVEALLNKKFAAEPPLELFLSNDDKGFADNFFKDFEINNDDVVIGFHPGCAILKNHIKRRWEPEKFVSLGNALIENYRAKVLIFGGSEENELKEEIQEKINSPRVMLVKANSVLQSAAIMKRCNVFVTNDSSQMHIASALQLKVVAIIGPTNTNYIHPWQTEHKIVSLNLDCSPCFFYSPKPLICKREDVQFKCIKELTVDMVYNAVKSFI
jgi:heptosyltransferase-2